MKKIFVFFCILQFLSLIQSSAQVIPDSLRVDWSQAGYQGIIPEPALILNVKDFGAYGDGSHNDFTAIQNAINSSTAFRTIFFPAGNYLIKSPVYLPDSVVLRGEGSATQLIFDLSKVDGKTNCITVSQTQHANYKVINSGYNKGSKAVVVNSSTIKNFKVGGYVELKEDNGAWASSSGYSDVGQIMKIAAINGDKIKFSSALRIDYSANLQPKVKPVEMKTCIGIECLKLTRLDAPSGDNSGINMSFSYAANCWVIGVESSKCQAAHLSLTSCSHITVSGCFFHDAFTYDGGGEAYGAQCRRHTSDCMVENSIFCSLRHAMIQQSGANGNVYAYNYSFDPKSTTEVPGNKIGDVSLHGDYAYANLFEGNIAQNIFVDDYWGPSGPYNTFFRNRAELFGVEIMDDYNYTVKSDRQNIVGNEITNTNFGKGNYILKGKNHFTYDNNVRGTTHPSGTNKLYDDSYYLQKQPYFWNISQSWPSIGYSNALNSGTNPARERWFSKGEKTVCQKQTASKLFVITAVNKPVQH